MPPLTRLVLFLLTQAPAPINIDFERYGSLGLLVYLVGEKLMPAILHIVRPRQEQQARREEEQAKRVRELETRQVDAWQKLADSNVKLAESNATLAGAITAMNERLGCVETDTSAMRIDVAKLMERTAGCEVRTQPKRARKETA